MMTNNQGSIFPELCSEDWDYLSLNSYVSQKYKLYYVATPKVACTSLKWWFAELEGVDVSLHDTRRSGETEPDLVIHEYFHRIAPSVTGLDRRILADVLCSDDFFSFAVVRNPFERIFSAWQSKVFLHVPMQIGAYLETEFLNREINSSYDIALSFEGFLEHIKAKEWPTFIDHHWMTQTEVLRFGKIKYSQISKIEESDELWRDIASHIMKYGGHMPAMKRANESLLPFSSKFITKRSAGLIRELYEIDFHNFGYSFELPLKQEKFDDGQVNVVIRASAMIRARHQRLLEIRSALEQESAALQDAKLTIISMNDAVSERDRQIARSSQAVTERDERIVSLSQAVTERDEQIVSLNQAVAEHDGQIDTLSRAVAERNEHIANLNQAAAVRDEKVKALSEAVTDLKSSTSWRVTRPLRFIGGLLELPKKLAFEVVVRVRKFLDRAVYRAKLYRWYRSLRHCPLFDRKWYLARNPDVSQSDTDPLWHYLVNGWRENRLPSPEFDGRYYRLRYPDIASLDQPPLLHYWRHGRYEGRHMNSLLDLEWLQADARAASAQQSMRSEDSRYAVGDLMHPQGAIFISVIIPTYNRIKLLPGIIESWREVHASTPFGYEIIFSDDGSSDGSVEYLESVKDLPLRVLRNAHGGASSARNAAINAACGERLLMIGDDIFPDKEILNVHARFAQQLGSSVAVLGTVDWHPDLAVNHLMHHITEIGNEQFSYNRLKDGSYVDFRHFYTCNISVDRRILLEEKTIFDERFNEYGFEDIELGYRLSVRGMKLYFTTLAKGAHYHPYSLESFCRRQTSSGRMAVVFSNIHPNVEQILGVSAVSRRARKYRKSIEQDASWRRRVDLLISRCNDYEELVTALPKDVSMGIRECLSMLYGRLFRAMYEFGVLDKLGGHPNALAVSMACNFEDSWENYWTMLAQNLGHPIDLNADEIYNLGEALNTGKAIDLLFGPGQRAVFDELIQIKALTNAGFVDATSKKRYGRLAARAFDYLINDPRYLIYRAKRAFLQITARQPTTRLPIATASVETAIMGLIVEPNNANREEAIAIFRAAFGGTGRVYERGNDKLLIPLMSDGREGEPVGLSDTQATIFFWPTSTRVLPLRDQLLNAYIALVENGLSLAVISHNLILGQSVSIGALRDNMLFSRDVADAVFNGGLSSIRLTGKILRLLPANGAVKEQNLDALIGAPVELDGDGFFTSSRLGAAARIRYKEPYLPPYIKSKQVVFVFPIFLAVGGVERNTVEIMRKLNDRYDFIVITMERLRPEQGSLAAQAIEVAAKVIEMSEIVRHTDYLRVLARLKKNLQPDIVWVCNGSPWFCDNAAAIRKVFHDVPIIDQEVYDAEQGWITRYAEAGIQSFDHFIAINKRIETRFLHDFAIDPERISLIYSAIDTSRIINFKQAQFDAASLRAKYGLPKGKKIYTFVARLTEQKRPLLFLNLAKSRLAHDDECYVLVGDGELASQALDFIKRHALKNVIRISYIENTLELNAVSDGIIFTSAYEGLPIAMLEAIAMGVPTFSTDVGDIANVLAEYGGGAVIPATCSDEQLNEAYTRWLARRNEYAANLRAREGEILDRFSSVNIAGQYVACWEKAMTAYGKMRKVA